MFASSAALCCPFVPPPPPPRARLFCIRQELPPAPTASPTAGNRFVSGSPAPASLPIPPTRKPRPAPRSSLCRPPPACLQGAVESIPIIANVSVMLITFVAFIALGDAILSWLGGLVGYPGLSFDGICAIAFLPFAFLMGVRWEDCHAVATLLGTKTIINEFVAYTQLSELIHSNALDEHSVVVATYALCGFSNFGGVGMMIGCLSLLIPGRLSEISSLAPRAMIGGTLACFATACVAGLIYR